MPSFTIKRRDGSVIATVEGPNLAAAIKNIKPSAAKRSDHCDYTSLPVGIDLRRADLSNADLHMASLRGADFREADLRDTNLHDADLSGADFRGALMGGTHLSGANLYGAVGLNKYLLSPMHMLRDQPGAIRAYKLVASDGLGIYYPQITYRVGESVEVLDANTDEGDDCGSGINLGTIQWCVGQWIPGYRILIVEHTAADIAAIPIASDGKYRVYRCKIVGEKDLRDVGLGEHITNE